MDCSVYCTNAEQDPSLFFLFKWIIPSLVLCVGIGEGFCRIVSCWLMRNSAGAAIVFTQTFSRTAGEIYWRVCRTVRTRTEGLIHPDSRWVNGWSLTDWTCDFWATSWRSSDENSSHLFVYLHVNQHPEVQGFLCVCLPSSTTLTLAGVCLTFI